MPFDLSLSRHDNGRDRRTWHGSAFIVEALVLLVFLLASIALLVQLMSAARERSAEAAELSSAIILASNEAETFAANPASGNREALFASLDGELVELTADGRAGVGSEIDDEAAGAAYELTRTVERESEPAGAVYRAHIAVVCDGTVVYEIDSSRYVSNEGVSQ